MNNLFLLLAIFITFSVKAQDSLKTEEEAIIPKIKYPYEVGYSFLTINSSYPILFWESSTPVYEFINGLLVRYKFNEFSLRLNGSFSDKIINKDHSFDCVNCSFGNGEVKDFKIGAGLQYSPFKKTELIYTYVDLVYRKRSEAGTFFDGAITKTINYKRKLNGLDFILGLGTKIKIYKRLYASCELGYDFAYATGKATYTDIKINNSYSEASNLNYTNLFTKIYLSLIF